MSGLSTEKGDISMEKSEVLKRLCASSSRVMREVYHAHYIEYVFRAAEHCKPTAEAQKAFDERKAEHPNWVQPNETPTGLTGWDGRTLDPENIQVARKYCEPGYSDPEKGILFADWNAVSKRVGAILERMGYALEWEDEWTTCGSCGGAFRTCSDSYSWQMAGVIEDGECVCNKCLDPEEHLKRLENNPRVANTIESIKPAEYGYIRQGEYENGWSGGNDDPVKIYEALRAEGHTRILFDISGVGQFDVAFDVYVHP
jgi:hypothetical protein